MSFTVVYNGKSCTEYGILPVRRPSIPAPEIKVEEIEVPGRDGILIETDNCYNPITISVEFNFLTNPSTWQDIYRKAKKWITGNGKLEFSDDPDFFYKVLYCNITDTERTSKRLGNFTAEFVCDPYCYVKRGLSEYPVNEVLYNPFSTSHPIYKISGNGSCILTVNGKNMTANVGQNIAIDTDLMISYRIDGEIINGSVTGNYEDLYLQEGENQISITDGFTLSVIPNWREL